jgi:hypothetical protein
MNPIADPNNLIVLLGYNIVSEYQLSDFESHVQQASHSENYQHTVFNS